jgi:hypothetical protein
VPGSRLHPRRRRSPRRRGPGAGERGFVLIAAIWLLILAGSIAAVLMLRSLAAATAAADRSEAIQRRLALESAVETMVADRLFNDTRSAWWMLPAQGAIAVGGRQVTIRVTSESGRIDVNNTDPTFVDMALRGFGVAAGERGRIVDRLRALRAMKRRIDSSAELENLMAGAGGPAGPCLAGEFTFVSGLAEPQPGQMSPALARALGGRGGATGAAAPAPPEAGAALRVEAAESGGAPFVAIVRPAGLADQPVQVSAWGFPAPCGQS